MNNLNVLSDTFSSEVSQAAGALRQGKVILYPTDTIWGLGCDVTNKSAVERVYEIKKRKASNPLIILVDSIAMLKVYAPNIHPRIETLLSYHVRPLTIIYKDVTGLPDHILASDGSMGIRVCKDDFCRAMITSFGRPVVSTSANRAGDPYPKHFGEIDEYIRQEADYIVSYNQDVIIQNEPSIIATYNRKGDLNFIRE